MERRSEAKRKRILAGAIVSGLGSVFPGAALYLAVNLLVAQPAAAADLVAEQATSSVTVDQDDKGFHIHTESRNYLYNSFVAATVEATTTAPLLRQILLVEKVSTLTEADNEDPEYEPSLIKVTVFPLTDKGKGPAQFTIATSGEEVKTEGSDLIITRPGCCVEYTTKAVYSLETGKYLFNATGDQWATLGAKGGFAMSRSAAVHMAPSAADDDVFGKAEHAGAVITYASPTAPLQRIMVMLPQEAENDVTLNWDGTLLWVSSDYPDGTNHIYVDRSDKPENVFTAATLRMKLDEDNVIDIPLRGDRLDIAAAKLPKGYSLTEMPLQ
ncbi:MAG TPA: hypothetical protein VM639_24070 [Dongiaceae bacterium]|nr:hypothetical protein [Dongiaceae bacterium]